MEINVVLMYYIVVCCMDRPELFMELLYKRITLVGCSIVTLSRPKTLEVRNRIHSSSHVTNSRSFNHRGNP